MNTIFTTILAGKTTAQPKQEYKISLVSERRKYFRKRLSGVGYIVENRNASKFQVEDLSIDGLGVSFDTKPSLNPGDIVRVQLPDLGLQGLVTVTRMAQTLDNRFSVGFYFTCSMLRPLNA